MTSLSTLLSSLDHGVHTGTVERPNAPSSPGAWLALARSSSWIVPAPHQGEGRRSDALMTVRGTTLAEPVTRARRVALSYCNEVATLIATVRAGALLEQRAAIARLAVLTRESSGTEVTIGEEAIASEPELERDVLLLLASQTGSRAREARSALADVCRLLETTESRLRASVAGIEECDPLAELEPHERAALALHLRGASMFVVGCVVDELLEGLTSADVRASARLLVGLRSAADPRLLPAFAGALLDSSAPLVRAEAARALARIDDPRVLPMLGLAHQTASAREERVALIEAFGMQGEPRDGAFLREALDYYEGHFDAGDPSGDPSENAPPSSGSRTRGPVALIAALDAIFDPALLEAAVRFATHPHTDVQRAALRAIGRVGGGSALAWLDRIDESLHEGLDGELETARAAILNRCELRSEKPELLVDAERRGKLRRALAHKFSRGLDVAPTRRHRALAWFLMLRALLVALVGGRESASRLAYFAFQADPGWYFPPLFQGRLWHGGRDTARAVTAYRRVLAIAPRRLFRNSRWLSPIISAFVARAEHLLREGHRVRAERLLDDLSPYDLSRAAPPVRLALLRCQKQLALPGREVSSSASIRFARGTEP